MDRRAFLGGAAAVTLPNAFAQSGAGKGPGFYLVQHYKLQLGSQATRLADYLAKTFVPALAKVNGGAALILDAQLSEHLPQVTVITAHANIEQAWSVQTRLRADKAFEAATDAWQAGPEPPYQSLTTELLEAAAFTPAFAAPNPQPKAPRIFESRIYQTHTERELRGLVGRFAEGEAMLLARAGAQLVLFGTTAVGPENPNLTWVLAFDTMEAREKFSAAFNADPDWVALRKQSLERWGQIPSYRRLTLYRAATYSPIW